MSPTLREYPKDGAPAVLHFQDFLLRDTVAGDTLQSSDPQWRMRETNRRVH